MNSKAIKLASKIKQWFSSWSEALKAGWLLVKLQSGYCLNIQFANKDAEVRKAKVVAISSITTGIEKGFIRFVEMVSDNRTQWRSFRLERLIF